MDIFKEPIVRLRNIESFWYLVADEDEETITLSHDRSKKDACWYVERVDEKPESIRLKNCQTGKYLCATNIPFRPDKPGKCVVQTYPQSQLDTSVIEWIPIQVPYYGFFELKTSTGSFLGCNNDGPRPLEYYITHDAEAPGRCGSWPLTWVNGFAFWWTLDVPEMQMEMSSPYPFDLQEPSFFKAEGISSKFVEDGKFPFPPTPAPLIKAGPLNRSRWRVLALIINVVVKLRLVLKEAHKNQEMMKLHCSLFPTDYAFERDTLVQLWMAAGYLRKGRMEEYGGRYFDILLNEGLILQSKNDNIPGKYVTNVGEAANGLNRILKFKDVDLLTVLKEERIEAKGADKPWHVSLTSNDINQSTFETLKRFHELRTLIFITNYGSSLRQLPADLFLALPCMEALDLSGSHITELPGSIGYMSQLRYLNLSFTLIESLPETICRLQELQTLNLEGCKQLYYLPKGFKKLINLRHLYFDVLGQLNFMPRGIGALTELRTLSAFIVDVEKGYCNIKELRYMNNLSGSCCITGLENITLEGSREASLYYKRLSQLQLRWNECGVEDQFLFMEAMSYLDPHPCLEELQMLHYPCSKLPWWICAKAFEQLCSITLRKCKVRRLDIPLGQLPNLKCLDIIQMDRVEIIEGSIHAFGNDVRFPKLEKLTIEGMLILASWTGVENGDFPVLTEFIIKDCPNLWWLPFIPFLGSLKLLEIGKCTVLNSLSPYLKLPKNLETLMIDDCPLLVMNCLENRAEWDKIKHVRHIWFDLEEMQSSPSGDGANTSLMGEYRLLLSNFNQLDMNQNVSTAPVEDVKACMLREEASFLENYGLEDEQKMAVSELRKLLDIKEKNAEISLIKPSQAKTPMVVTRVKEHSKYMPAFIKKIIDVNYKPQISGTKAEVQSDKWVIQEKSSIQQLLFVVIIGSHLLVAFTDLCFTLRGNMPSASFFGSIQSNTLGALFWSILWLLSIQRKRKNQALVSYYFLFPAIFVILSLNKGFGNTT